MKHWCSTEGDPAPKGQPPANHVPSAGGHELTIPNNTSGAVIHISLGLAGFLQLW